MSADAYLKTTKREFERLKRIAELAVAQLDNEQYIATLGPEDNSIAVMVKHMAGNMLSRWRDFLSSDGEKPDRNRDGEFEIGEQNSRDQLNEMWERGWDCLFEAIAPLEKSDLDRTITIRGESHTVLQATSRQLTHYAYHVGQVVFVAKHLAGDRWKTLSVPKGESETFNQSPDSYLETAESENS